MAWQEVETDVGEKVGRCSYSVHLKHGGARVSLPPAVADLMKWTAKTRFKLQVGAGESEGQLRLVATADGKIAGKSPPKGKGLLVRLGRWKSLAPRDVDKVFVEHDADPATGALIVHLPPHALMAAPAPRAPVVPPKAAPAGAARTDVTSKFFDDPKKTNGRPVSRPPT